MDDSKMRKIAGVMLGMVAILAVIALMIPEPESAPDYSGALDESAITKLLPSTERDAEISLSGGEVTIVRDMRENLTPAMMLSGARIHSIDIFKNLFEDPRIEQVTVISNTEFVDEYGQPSTAAGCWYRISRETADKVNWGGLPFENLDKIADLHFVHPALRG